MSGTPYTLDDYGFWGPNYSFADNLPLPGQINVRQDSSFDAIFDAVGGVNFYIDSIAFGSSTFFDENPTDKNGKPYQHPLGLRYFLNTGMRCSNGATMSQYFNGVTRGDLLGTHIQEALASASLPGLQGMAPGLVENAIDALDPRPIIAAVTSSGYPQCEAVQCPVGDSNGEIQDLNNASQPYIIDPTQLNANGVASQIRWVQAYDDTGSAINLTKDEFAATPKCYNADGSYITVNPPSGCAPVEPPFTGRPASNQYPLCTQPPPSTTEAFSSIGSVSNYSILMAGLLMLIVVCIFITSAEGWSALARNIRYVIGFVIVVVAGAFGGAALMLVAFVAFIGFVMYSGGALAFKNAPVIGITIGIVVVLMGAGAIGYVIPHSS